MPPDPLELQRAFAKKLREPTVGLEGDKGSLGMRAEIPVGRNTTVGGGVTIGKQQPPRAGIDFKYQF